MIFDCNIVRASTIQAVDIKTISIYCVVTNTTTTESVPTETTSVATESETPVTTHDPSNTTMATKEATQEDTTTEPDLAKRKNDSKCLFNRIICFFGIKYFHTRYALLMILFLKTSITNLEIFVIRILI